MQPIDRAAAKLSGCDRLLFITGAGMSADSGLPTYRGVGGLYDLDDTEDGLPIEQLLSGRMLEARPELTWKYLAQIADACRGATFNRGHAVLAEMERHYAHVCILTQNVDGFHRSAGSLNVIDIHGDLHELLCTGCGRRDNVEQLDPTELPPRCGDCGAVVRPDVVLFGEELPLAKFARLRQELAGGFDIVFAIGTTAVFPYIAQPVIDAARAGCPTVEINPGRSEISSLVDIHLKLPAAEALDTLWQRVR